MDKIILLNDKIIIPKSLRTSFLQMVHKGHFGISKTYERAKELFFWPDLKQDIKNYVLKCKTCEQFRPNNTRNPLICHD